MDEIELASHVILKETSLALVIHFALRRVASAREGFSKMTVLSSNANLLTSCVAREGEAKSPESVRCDGAFKSTRSMLF